MLWPGCLDLQKDRKADRRAIMILGRQVDKLETEDVIMLLDKINVENYAGSKEI